MSPRPTSDQSKVTSPVAIWAGMFTVYLVWGSTYLAIRFAVETMPPFLMASVRFIIAGLVLYLIRRTLGDPTPTRREWRSAAVIGFFLLVGGNGGVAWAEQHIPSGLAALIVSTVPLWMVLLDALKPKGSLPSTGVLFGILLGFAGIVLLFWPDPDLLGAGTVNTLGALALTLAAISWAYGSLYSRKAVLPESPLLGTSMEMLAGGAGLLVLGVFTGEVGRVNLAGFSPQSWLSLAYLIVFGSWIGFATYTWLLRVAPTSLVSTYAYVNPVVAIFIGFIFAGETLNPRSLIAAVIILGSVVLTTLGTRSPVPKTDPQINSLETPGKD